MRPISTWIKGRFLKRTSLDLWLGGCNFEGCQPMRPHLIFMTKATDFECDKVTNHYSTVKKWADVSQEICSLGKSFRWRRLPQLWWFLVQGDPLPNGSICFTFPHCAFSGQRAKDNYNIDLIFGLFSIVRFQDTGPKRITILRSNSAHNSINHGKNRAKITNPNVGWSV